MLVFVSAAPVSGCGCYPVVVFVDGVFLRCGLAVCVVFFYWFGDCVGVLEGGWVWVIVVAFALVGFG